MPMVFSMSLNGWFLKHFDNMQRFRHYVQAGVMVGLDARGEVKLDKSRGSTVELDVSDRDIERLRRGIKKLSEIFFAGGARRVLPSTYKPLEFSNPSDLDLIDDLVKRPEDLFLGTAHPQGGNAIGNDSKRGVVSPEFRVHGYDNVFVADASVFPTNIWANCQATVMALSHYAAGFVSA
jgi:choline dehydrogenase-like flavoprotein